MADAFVFDELKMYFGEDYFVTDKICIHTPSVGEIVEYGEKEYYSMIHLLTCIPSDMKSQLDDMGFNYMEVSNFELFIMLSRSLTAEKTSILFGDLDFSRLIPMKYDQTDDLVLYDKEKDIIIDSYVHMKIAQYLCKMHYITPKIENAANETTRKILIQLERDKLKKAQKEEYKSQLKDLISGLMRYPGFPYKKNELKECGIYEFMDCVQGAQIYVNTTSLLSGMYSGMVDTSKINKKEFNWMRSINE